MPSSEVWDRVERLLQALGERTRNKSLPWEKQDSVFSEVYMTNMSGASIFLEIESTGSTVGQYKISAMDSSGNAVLQIDTDSQEIPDTVLTRIHALANDVVDVEEARLRGFLDGLLDELGK